MRLVLILSIAFLLRTVALGKYPVGFYADEAAFGYNAYLLLHTAHDEYGKLWPVSLTSFGDWKPPMQAWLSIPTIALFGLGEFAVRLPSAILGTATVAVIYFLAEELFPKKLAVSSWQLNVGEIASLLLAISPWHIFMSRAAMLVAVEAFFISFGVLGLFRGLKKPIWWVLSAVSFSLALYSYYGSRVTVPLLLLVFISGFARPIIHSIRFGLLACFVGFIVISPLLFAAYVQPLVLTGRAKTTSVFFNDNVRLQLWDAHTKAGLRGIPPITSRFFDNKAYYYAADILGRYWSHFSPAFLFFKGDSHPPFKIPRLGYLHVLDAPFFVVGLIVLRKNLSFRKIGKRSLFLFLYLLIAPLVASFTFLTPAANRSFNLVVPWTIVVALGLFRVLNWGRFKQVEYWGIIMGLYVVSMSVYVYSYVVLTPLELGKQVQYGRRELVTKLKPLLIETQTVYMTNQGGPPYIFLSFYLPIEPREFHETIVRNPFIDELGWGHVDKVQRVIIPRQFHWSDAPKVSGAIYVGFEDEITNDQGVDILDRVYYPNGNIAYSIARFSP